LDRWSGSRRAEWAARFLSAKEAASKALGAVAAADVCDAEIVEVDADSGGIWLRPAPASAADRRGEGAPAVRAVSGRRGDYAWAWVMEEGG
jgi:hypothetical protein